MNPIITIKDSAILTNSADVADIFEKAPRHVVRDIDQLLPKIGQLEQQHGFIAPPMFLEVWSELRRAEGPR